MPITLRKIEIPVPCMDCEKYSSDCDHMNRLIKDIRTMVKNYDYQGNVEISIILDCQDRKLCS